MPERKTDLPPLSESQLEVMHILWDKGEATLGEVWSGLTAKRSLAKNTVQTLLTRLVDKGWVAYRQEGNAFVYRSARERQAAHKQILQRVLDLAFQGSTEGLMMSLLEGKPVGPEEAQRLRELIDQAEKQSK